MVLNGIDQIDSYSDLFCKRRIGLITSPSGLNAAFDSSIDILHRRFGLTALFSPEHGVRGNMDAGALVDTYTDPKIHVPVYSLYRSDSKRLTDEMLENIDLVAYDIQDVGTRYYTFIYTMLYAMQDCAKRGIEFVVFDRLNPLGGETVEGNVMPEAYQSFIGGYPLCMRYGMTIGEFARMANEEQHLGCKLKIVPCAGWERRMLFPDTGRTWVMPSPGMPRFEAALLYPGTCFFEGTNISEGRGTSTPFEVFGAPFLDGDALARRMNAMNLPGVRFRPVYFTPYSSKFKDEQCSGVQIHVLDPHAVRAVETGLNLLFTIRDTSDQFRFLTPETDGGQAAIDLLTGGRAVRDGTASLSELIGQYQTESVGFARRKQPFHLY